MDLTKLTLQLCMFVCLVTKVMLDSFVILWTIACQAPRSLGFSRKGYWSGLPCPLSGDCSSVSWGLKVVWLSCIKNLPTKAGDTRDMGFNPWVRKILWRRKWQPTPVFLPGKSHGQRNLVGYSPWDCKEVDATEHTHMLGSANSSAPCLRPFHQTPCRDKQCVVNYWMEGAEERSVLVGLPGDRASILNESQEKAHLGQLLSLSPGNSFGPRIALSLPNKAFAYFTVFTS